MIETIKFTFKNKEYIFSHPFTVGTNPLNWIHECYTSVGAKPHQVKNRMITYSHWNFWSGFIA